MKKRAVVLAAVFGVLVVIPAAALGAKPRWVTHVDRYPGGISNGVRAYADPAVSGAAGSASRQSAAAGPAASGPIDNRRVNDFDATPKVPQNETQVVHSELNDRIAVAAANDYVNGGSQIYRTTDGGQTWNTQFRSSRVLETGDFCGGGGDPALAYSVRDQAFYFAQLCFFRAHPESEVEIIRSTNEGQTWTGSRDGAYAATNFDPDTGEGNPAVFYDKEQITVDNNLTSPHFGRLYVTYVKFHMQPDGFSDYCTGQVAWTDNIDPNGDGDLRDTVWSHHQIVPNNPGGDGTGATANQGLQPAVDDQGGLDVSYMSEDCNTSIDRSILFRRSTNGGGSFGPAVRIDKPGQWKDNPDPDDLLPPKRARIAASTSAPLVFNPTDNSLNYIVQNNVNRETSGADITFTKSYDYGQTWTDMVPVSVDGSGNPARNDQFFPWMDVDGAGNLHAIWFDNRRNAKNLRIRTFQGESNSLGQTWLNRDISTESWNPNQGFFTTGSFIGDYNGLAAGDDVIYPIWTDGRDSPGPPNGDTDVWTNVELTTTPFGIP